MSSLPSTSSSTSIRRRGVAAVVLLLATLTAGTADASAGAVAQPARVPTGSSAAGSVLATPETASGNFLLRANVFTPLPDLPGALETSHVRVNNRGETAGVALVGDDAAPTFYGFVQRHGSFRRIDVRGASSTLPFGLNDRGQVAGVYLDADQALHGFVRDGDGDLTRIDVRGASETVVYDINNRGRAVGYYIDANGVQHGLLWARGRVTLIDPPDVAAEPDGPGTRVLGLNDHGDVVGS
jgi:hypothetical protein